MHPAVLTSKIERNAQAAIGGTWLEKMARLGWAAKGVVYVMLGLIAVQAARGTGGSAQGSRGALRSLTDEPFGQILLALVALGLLCYGVWRLLLAALDLGDEGDGAKAIVKRIGYAVSGLINLALAIFAATLVFGSGGGSGGSSKEGMTAQLMAQPFGQWLVGIVGAIIVCTAIYQFVKGAKATFMHKYKAGEMSAAERTWGKRLGRIGFIARGIAFGLIGGFVIQAALQHDPSETGGLDQAFSTLREQPYGVWLLGAVALGFVAYGIFCFSYARYRHFQTA